MMCSTCGGKGEIPEIDPFNHTKDILYPCLDCEGTGKAETCPDCGRLQREGHAPDCPAMGGSHEWH